VEPAPAAPARVRRPRQAAEPAPAAAAPAAAAPVAAAPPASTAVAVAPTFNMASLAGLYAPGGALSVFAPAKHSGLSAIVSTVMAKGEPNVFPTVYLTGGSTGGMLDTDAMNPEGSDDDLPTGRKAVGAILVGYRISVNVWPHAGSDKPSGESPKWKAILSHQDGDILGMVMQSVKKYQFSKGAGKERHAQVFDAFGHPQIALELLLCDARVGLMVMRTCGTYESVANTALQLQKIYEAEGRDGSIFPEGVRIVPTSQTFKSKTREWLEHWPVITVDRDNAEVQAAGQTFAGLFQSEGLAELTAAIGAWCASTITDEQCNVLDEIGQQDCRS
jgi:hypothetical protein